jgi:hypothetical protein
MTEHGTEILIVGGGVGGVSAALAALERGRRVILTEETDWLGGQLTTQLVPSDEHIRVETTGRNESYARFRELLRDHYRSFTPLTAEAAADPHLNPGAGWVSPVCVEPRVILSVINSLLRPFISAGQLTVLLETRPVSVATTGDRIDAVTFQTADGSDLVVSAQFILDATELGDLLELGGVEHVSGRESREQTGEPSAADTADPLDMQGVTWCFAMDHREGEDHTIERPARYEHFRDWRPSQLHGERILGFERAPEHPGDPARRYALTPNPGDDPFAIDVDHRNMGGAPELWTYRRILARRQFEPGFLASDVTIVNWPMNDYIGGPVFGVADAAQHREAAKELSASLLYWLQTEAPRPDGGTGWPGLRLRPDIAGTDDGFAKVPYYRESRRLLAEHTIVEQEISVDVLGDRPAVSHADSIGVGHYFWIDRHPSTGGHPGGGGRPQPFEIPLGALIPRRVENLLAAAKNIGTTQITNGSYRLQPVEWSIGEAAGALAAYAVTGATTPREVRNDAQQLADFQADLVAHGAQLRWDPALRW